MKGAEEKSKEKEINEQPKGSPAEESLRQQAAGLNDEAQNLRDSAADLKSELDALRNALKQGDAGELRKRAQGIAPQVRDNQLGDAQANQKNMADRLEKRLNALDEKTK